MPSLRKLLESKRYKRIKLEVISTGHLQCKAFINGVEGSFILDTGASSSCIDSAVPDFFDILAEYSDVRAAGAGASNLLTKTSVDNKVKIGDWTAKKIKLVVFDLSHVNAALEDHSSEKVQGILGADILEMGRAVIDYKTKHLYLK